MSSRDYFWSLCAGHDVLYDSSMGSKKVYLVNLSRMTNNDLMS